MALTLQLVDPDGTPLPESYAILDEELLDYLSVLSGFPTLQGLRELAPDADTRIDPETGEALAREAVELAARVRRREVPEPPDHVGLEGLGDIRLGEELGWSGLLRFLQRVEHLVSLSKRLEMELWALAER
jgi:hypothetical protein